MIQGFACAGMTVEHAWNRLDGFHIDATGEMVRAKYGKGYTEYGQVFSGPYMPDLPTLFERWRHSIRS